MCGVLLCSTVDKMLWKLEENLDKLRKATHQGPLQKMAHKVCVLYTRVLLWVLCVFVCVYVHMCACVYGLC